MQRVGLRAGQTWLVPDFVPGNGGVGFRHNDGFWVREGKVGVERCEHPRDDGVGLHLPCEVLGLPLLLWD